VVEWTRSWMELLPPHPHAVGEEGGELPGYASFGSWYHYIPLVYFPLIATAVMPLACRPAWVVKTS